MTREEALDKLDRIIRACRVVGISASDHHPLRLARIPTLVFQIADELQEVRDALR